MKKYLIMFLCIFLLVGCSSSVDDYGYAVDTIYYHLTIQDYYQEEIVFTFPSNAYELAQNNMNEDFDSLEYVLLLDNFSRPIFNNQETLYQKNIQQVSNGIQVDLAFDYLESDFANSNFIHTCFEKQAVDVEDDYFDVQLSGEFYCLQDKQLVVEVQSVYESEFTNGVKVDDSFQWIIDSSNYQDVNIHYRVYRDKNVMKTSYNSIPQKDNHSTNSLVFIEFIVCVIALLIGFFIYQNKKRNEDSHRKGRKKRRS